LFYSYSVRKDSFRKEQRKRNATVSSSEGASGWSFGMLNDLGFGFIHHAGEKKVQAAWNKKERSLPRGSN